MDKYPIQLKEKVNKLIGEMETCAYLFSKNGEKDFTRKRKIPFSKVIKLLICMGGQSLNRELLDAWQLDRQTPTESAFIQQRSKLSQDALPFLFKELNEMFPGNRDIHGYRILACTNLDPVSFPPNQLKRIYNLRWGVETSFRDLKYTIGLTAFHSRKAEFICQEIFARLIFYNLCELVVSHAAIFHKTASHMYQLNFSQAVHILRRFFSLRSNDPPLDVISLIQKYLLPVRPNRCNPRKVHYRSAISFIYRIA